MNGLPFLDVVLYTGQQKLLCGEHHIEGAKVDVTKCDFSQVASNITPATESTSQCTVVVKELIYSDKNDAVDCLELYFDNEDNSGGKIIDNGITISKGKVFITFQDSKGSL